VRIRVPLAAALVALVAAAGCGGSDGGSAVDPADVEGPVVVLRDIAFSPAEITVPAGDTVTWVFDDRGIPHNVVADDKAFESETMDDGRFTHRFGEPGTFGYVCTLHPNMKGTVRVT